MEKPVFTIALQITNPDGSIITKMFKDTEHIELFKELNGNGLVVCPECQKLIVVPRI
jgi:hypothetical protein